MKRRAPRFDWREYDRLVQEDPSFDAFTHFSFSQVSMADRSEIARRIIENKLSRARPAQETAP